MKHARISAGLIIMVALISLNACSGKPNSTQPVIDQVRVNGTVYAWFCSVGDSWNNPVNNKDLMRFSAVQSEPAVVTFIRADGRTCVIETNEASDFSLYLSQGLYKVSIATGFNYPPDTIYNVCLSGDTTLSLDFRYDVVDPLNLNFIFWYPSFDETLGIVHDRDVLWSLNEQTALSGQPHMLELWPNTALDAMRTIVGQVSSGTVYIYYQVPIRRVIRGQGPIYNVVEVHNYLNDVAEQDTTGVYIGLGIELTGSYICMFAR